MFRHVFFKRRYASHGVNLLLEFVPHTMINFIRRVVVAMLLCSMAQVAFAQKGMDQININGQFVIAARSGNVERAAALLQDGAKVNSRDRNGDSPLNMAASKGNNALVDILLKAEADVNLANLSGVTPLMAACFSASPQIVRKLLAAGASITPLDRVKKNAATYAVANGCTDCLAALLGAGTVVNAPLDNDLTLLMWAAAYGHEASVRFLLAEGANRALKDLRGKTAAEMAKEGGHASVAALLSTQ
jgi:uncharacterized protein